ncbi:Tim44 domain-containing protein [Undibacterium sp. TJN25]|uniref:Tim44 domain-containing protein n=1 Tax=Undibacterium sp. TJN25 TaxID=3413056 RepID=UPI003BF1310D
MKKFFIAMMVVASALAVTVSDADARRLGGGGSIGRQSSNVSRQASPPSNAARPAPAPAAPAASPNAPVPPRPASPWKGIVGGLIGGALLGAMFSSMGFGGALSSMLGSIATLALLAVVVMFIVRMFRKNSPVAAVPSYPSAQYQQPVYAGSSSAVPEIGSRIEPQAYAYQAPELAAPAAAGPWGVPADFDVPAFLRNAKTYFIRLQAAWDRADINDIREFTTPEMYAEIKLQIQERGASANVTDVVSIDAELLGLEQVGNDHLASIRFSGMIKEAANAPVEPFNEVWNLSKPLNGQGGWVLAGIQQLS